MKGLVIRNTGSLLIVLDTDTGAEMPCKIKGNFRLKGIRTTNPVAVGDHVEYTAGSEGVGFITEVLPRRNYIIRRASNLSKESHILAANVDQAALVATLAQPVTSTTFIDRFLATCEAYRVKALLVINKTDLLMGVEDCELLDAVSHLYASIGYDVVRTSTKTGEGIGELRVALEDKITLFSGNSGVGKSSLINRLIPGLDIKTAPVSEAHEQGIHTTTFSEMYRLPDSEGGWIIDTPGVRGFGTIEFERNEVAHYFPEIFKSGANCRFGNCTHTHEPGCAVLKDVENHRIAQSRYSSYLSILSDSEQDKYRKPF